MTDANGCSNSDEIEFESCASIFEQTGISLVLYPNSVASTARIEIENFEGNVTVSIKDLNGKIISSFSQFAHGIVDLDLAALNSGVYYVDLVTDNGYSVLKIVKE